jgi:hypothetical protein
MLLAALAMLCQVIEYEVDGTKRHPISPYVYGHNHPDGKVPGWTFNRVGGNRLTAYNWETNASNAGSDWHHQNDNLMGNEIPGEPVRASVAQAHAKGAACVVTIPIIGRVAADKKGGGDVAKTPDYLNTRFLPSLSRKPTPFADAPDLADGKVYQDEFVHWLEKAFPEPRPPIFYALDNEPDIWSHTHARIHPEKVRYDELCRLNVEYAEAVKRVAPRALVFGFVSYGWHGFTTLQDAPDRAGRDFLDVYLAEMAAAEAKAGKRLIDVLDVHWYPEARGKERVMEDDASPATSAARIQAPRSLWDPGYKEESWILQVTGGPIRLLPRLREKIAKRYPGTKLAITEYYYGGGADISGGIAQADVLGVFGREGVFAAALWHMGKTDDRFIHAAFAMFRNFDGQGGAFGDTGLDVSGGDPSKASLYASVDGKGRKVFVAINKTAGPLKIRVGSGRAQAWRLTSAEPKPVPAGDVELSALEVPPLSVTTLRAD